MAYWISEFNRTEEARIITEDKIFSDNEFKVVVAQVIV